MALIKYLPVIALLIFGFAVSNSIAAPTLLDRMEASVNSSLILRSDVKKFRKIFPLRSQLDPLFAGTAIASKGDAATVAEIVQYLIDERLIALAFPVTDAEVEQSINEIQANNHIDRAGLKKAIQEQGFAFEEYFELIRISASKRNLIDRDIRTKVTISDDDVKNYYYNRYSRGGATPMAYRLQMITVSFSTYKTPQAAKEVAIQALKDAKGGEAFEEVAKRVSDDPNASAGGDLGTLTDDQMSPSIKDQVKKLQIGQISDLLGGPDAKAYYILKLVDVKAGDSERLNKLKEEIKTQLVAAEYQHQMQLWLDRQRQSAFIHRAGEAPTVGLPVAPAGS